MASCVQSVIRFLKEDYFMSDEFLALFMPIVVYWAYSGMYTMMGSLEKYRLHSREDEELKNMVSKREVIRGVLLQQATQSFSGTIIFVIIETTGIKIKPTNSSSISPIVIARQFLVAMVFIDTWQYFIHRCMHTNKFLYRHIHSWHHKIVVPYAFGALYIHPGDSIVHTIGGGLTMVISGMSPRVSIFFFSFLVIKLIDDHCGLLMPGNVLHMLFGNSTAFHDSHHHLFGNKYNFGQPFFLWWDKMLGTYMPYKVVKRSGCGFEIKPTKESED